MWHIIYSLFLLCIILLTYGFFSTFFYDVNEYTVKSKELYKFIKDKKIIILSDLHNVCYSNNNDKIIDDIDRYNPAFIIIAGDMVNHKSPNNNEYAKNVIVRLSEKYTIYYADGNHEQGFFENADLSYNYDKFNHFFSKSGYKKNDNIIHLANEYIEFPNKIRLYGLQINRPYYRRTNRPSFDVNYLEKLLGKSDKNCYNIVIAHNPLYFEDYVKWGADIVISGHVHGGFVRLPFIGGIISPQLNIFPKYSAGLYKYKKGTMILSRGLGMHTIRFRFLNSPEIVVLGIQDAE